MSMACGILGLNCESYLALKLALDSRVLALVLVLKVQASASASALVLKGPGLDLGLGLETAVVGLKQETSTAYQSHIYESIDLIFG